MKLDQTLLDLSVHSAILSDGADQRQAHGRAYVDPGEGSGLRAASMGRGQLLA